MRVAHDLSIHDTPTPTGVERAQHTLLHALLDPDAERTHEHVLLAPGRVPEPWREHDSVEVVEGRGGAPWLWRETVVPRAVRTRKIDLFHSPVAALPMRLRCPMIATVHEIPWAGEDAGPGDERASHRLRLTLAANLAWRLVCPSERTAEHVRRVHPDAAERVRVLPHALTPDLHAAEHAALAREPGLVLCVGRLRAKKNLAVLLEAFARLEASGEGAPRLVIVGPEGEAEAELRERASQPDLAGRVRFAGFVSDAELGELYARAACVVMPSLFEGFGLPALEAMAAGAPLISARGGVVDELVSDAALVVAGDEPAAFSEALARVLGDERVAQDLVAAGRARAAQFSLAKLRRDVHALYAEWRA
ncbi:MAG: hypothetical protein DHS20C15_11240 [Planctomycetota bacterium]|nr:MAG: hypothetical protein DHS20C15_11240 [Planctomycetota bacterium]